MLRQPRLGTLFMDLDALSGVIAYKHTGEDVTTVTAAVDRITINHPLKELCDLELSGQVTYATGRSSMEISCQVARAPKKGFKVEKKDTLMTCAFTMVSLDPGTKKPVAICPIKLETAEDKRLFALGEKNSNERKAQAKTALRKQTPNDEESDLIHAMWLKQLDYHGKHARPTLVWHTLTLRHRPKPANTEARKCDLYGEDAVAQLPNNATSIPEPPQFHDLRWFPPQTNLRARLLLCCGFLPLSSDVFES